MKKRAITLIEIMIVILLIGIIGGTLAVNMRGSLDKGRAFTTEQNMRRIEEALVLEHATGKTLAELQNEWQAIVKRSPLLKGDKAIKDGWNKDFKIDLKEESGELVVKVTSERYVSYVKSQR